MRIKQRITWVAVGLGLAFSYPAGQAQTPAPATATAQTRTNLPPVQRRSSIILIVADGLGYGDLGCYGQTRIQTPHLDKLAAEGMRFTSFYAGSAAEMPSRASLMLGKDTGHLRIRGDGYFSIQSDDVTIAEVMKGPGYKTGAIGEWGIAQEGSAGVPEKKGFQDWLGFLTPLQAQERYPTFIYRADLDLGMEAKRILSENLNGQRVIYADDLFASAATRFISNNVPGEFNGYRPFFLYLAGTLPGNHLDVPGDAYSGEVWADGDKQKAAMITRLDGYVGLIMEELKGLKIDNNTLLLFTSANGPGNRAGLDPKFFNSSGPWRSGRNELFEGNLRVPFLARWPLYVRGGRTNDLPLAAWDVLPTLVDIARLKPPKDTDGFSFEPALLGMTQTNRHEFLYWETHDGGFKQAARMGEWKGIRSGVDGPLELYNLTSDPGEKTNVAIQRVEVAGKILDFLKTARTADPQWPAKTMAENAAKLGGENK